MKVYSKVETMLMNEKLKYALKRFLGLFSGPTEECFGNPHRYICHNVQLHLISRNRGFLGFFILTDASLTKW